jgi:predicted phage tail protein
VTLEGYDTGTIAAFAVAGNVTGKDLTLVKTGTVTYTVSGVISTSDGAGAADASVSIKKDGTPLGSAVTAGADGAYTISGVPAGTYTIEASLEGYANGTLSVTVSAENVTGQNLTLEKAEAADTTPPAKVSGLTGSPGNGQVSLSWTDPADTDLASIEITWSSGNGSATVDKGAETYTATGLTNGTEYTFTVKAVDASGNKSEGETTTHTPADTAPPAAVAGLTAVPGKWIVRLTWTDPADADLASIVITWTAGSGGTETVTKSTRADRANSKIITGLTNGIEYTFTVKAKDAAGNLNAGETAVATPSSSLNSDL